VVILLLFQGHSGCITFVTGSLWLYIAPFGMRRLLGYIAKHYGNPKIIITENGCSTKHMPNDGSDVVQLDDKQRCDYVKAYINEALKGIAF